MRRRDLLARLAVVTLAVVPIAACDGGDGAAPTTATGPATTVGDPWQRLVDETLAASPGVPALALAVLAPGRGLDVAVAAGRSGDAALGADQPFRLASNTKTYTAAATLRLVEEGRLGLDDTLAERADPALVALLDGDGYDTGAITVRHLLQHTSGLYDYASDVDYQTIALGEPDGHWSRADQVRFAVEEGDPLGPPGRRSPTPTPATSSSATSSSGRPARRSAPPCASCSTTSGSAWTPRGWRRSSSRRPACRPAPTSSTRPRT